MRVLLLVFALCCAGFTNAQNLEEINKDRLERSRKGMLVLGSWAVGNMIASPVLRRDATGSDKYFYNMNVYWNAVNLAIAGFGYFGALRNDPGQYNLQQSIKEQQKIEKILLFNAGLDLAYVASGLYASEQGSNNNDDRLKGYGESIILQGAFLFVFDMIFYLSHQKGGKVLDSQLGGLSLSSRGIGLKFTFR